MKSLILTDMLPRFDCDYGHGTPIRTPGAYRIGTVLGCTVLDYFFHLTFDKQIEILDKYLVDVELVGLSLTNMRGQTKNFKQESLLKPHERIGTSSNTVVCFPDVVEQVLRYLRLKYPHIKICIGGGQITNISLEGLSFVDSFVDYIVTGEADISVCNLSNPISYDSWNIGSHNYKFKNTKVIHSDKDYPVSKDYMKESCVINNELCRSNFLPGEWTFIEISRGCIFDCYFCSYRHSNKRRSTESIKQELINNYNTYGTTRYRFLDDTFNDNKQKVEEICKMLIDLPFEVEWHSYARTDVFSTHPHLIDLVYESGCKYLKFGLESTNNNALRRANKMLGHEKSEKVINEIYSRTNGDLYTHSNFIIGLPGETEESQRNTFEWIKQSTLKTYSLTTWNRDRFYDNMIDVKEMSEFGKDKEFITGYGNTWTHDTMNYVTAYSLYDEALEELMNGFDNYWVGSDLYPILRTYGINHDDVDSYMKLAMLNDYELKTNLENNFANHVTEYYKLHGFDVKNYIDYHTH